MKVPMRFGYLACLLLCLSVTPAVWASGVSAQEAEVPPASVAPTDTPVAVPLPLAPDTPPARPTLVEKLRESAPATNASVPSPWTMIVGLAATLALLFGLAWFSRRLQGRLGVTGRSLKVIDTLAVGPRERICVVTDGQKRLLLGITAQQITLLDSGPNVSEPPETETAFSDRIRTLLQNGAPHGP